MMKIEKIIIKNYKSIGEENNSIFWGSDVITLVGKNGSGKSNWLDALNGIKFFKPVQADTFKCKNVFIEDDIDVNKVFKIRISQYDYNYVLSDMPPSKKDEVVTFDFGLFCDKYVTMRFYVDTEENEQGSFFSDCLSEDVIFCEAMEELQDVIKKDTTAKSNDMYKLIYVWLDDWPYLYAPIDFEWLKQHYARTTIAKKLDYIQQKYTDYIDSFAKIMPNIIIIKDQMIEDCYKKEDLTKNNKEFFHKESGLNNILLATGLHADDLISALGNANNNITVKNRNKIQKQMKLFSEEFNNFYNSKKEKIELEITCEQNQCILNVYNDDSDNVFKYSERSQGLKWYLSFFASLKAAEATNNALILLDEPAIHLHVDAQKEVLSLFNTLKNNGIQIMYTTHSPAMLNINSWESIKLVEKEDNITKIFSPTTSRSGQKHIETLSPIQQAMGCTLNNTIAPQREKLNLVVEGITDYYYIKAMFQICNVKDKPYVIPACSADNIPNIISIFIGWGYKYNVLLDHDNKGQDVQQKLIKLAVPVQNIHFVSNSENATIEDLISPRDKEKILIYDECGKLKKSESAFNFLTKIECKEFTPDDETKNNFQTLFQKFSLYDN